MTKLVELIQKIALSLLENEKLMTVQFGRVESECEDPLQVRLSEKLVLDAGFLIQTDTATYQPGDTLVLLRDYGGQRYLVVGKKV